MDYQHMTAFLMALCERYPFVSYGSLGQSILGRSIPLISIGEGKKAILYVGSHHGMEWITTTLLLRFLRELCEVIEENNTIFRYSTAYLCESRTLYIVPMLNPDGVEYALHGICEDNPLYERLLKMNDGDDFHHWQANARGVDLNHNYNCGFAEYKVLESEEGIEGGAPTRYSGEMPESEPEVGCLCNFLRFHEEIGMALTLHTQGREIYYKSGDVELPSSYRIARSFARMTGYNLGEAEGMAAYGGMTDWMIRELGRPCFTVECGKGKNPLPSSDLFEIYTEIREMLFCAPMFL